MDKGLRIKVQIFQKDDNFAYAFCDDSNSQIIDEIFGVAGIGKQDPKDVYNMSFNIWLEVPSIDELLEGQKSKSTSSTDHPEYPFAQELLINKNTDQDNKDKEEKLLPIIHLVPTSIFVNNLYGSSRLSSYVPRLYQIMDNSIWNYIVPIVPFNYPDYIFTDDSTKGNDFEIDKEIGIKREKYNISVIFKETIKTISKNYKNKLYKLEISKEYADLNARLASESFLSGGHASGVAPFIFHSESAIDRLLRKEFKTGDKDKGELSVLERIKERNWRILLVDDKSKDCLQPSKYNVTKLQIIKCLLEEKFEGLIIETRSYKDSDVISEDEKKTLLIEFSETIQEAEEALSKRKYDLILLDYLLEKEERQYGYELLENIYNYTEAKKIFESSSSDMIVDALQGVYISAKFDEFLYYVSKNKEVKESVDNIVKEIKKLEEEINSENNKKIKSKKAETRATKIKEINDIIREQFKTNEKSDKYLVGPHEQFYFMFISAYTSAVYERLLAEGLNRNEKYWYIAVGACPTNTPKLFMYNLLKLMEKQLDDSGITKMSPEEIYRVANKIYGGETVNNEWAPKVRRNANDYYQEVLNLQYRYKKMLADVDIPRSGGIFNTNGSVLITDFIKENVNLGGFLEHFTQMVHLTAFGTVRQWREIWEEYIYFKSQFNISEFKDKEKFYKLCVAIEKYVIALKEDIK